MKKLSEDNDQKKKIEDGDISMRRNEDGCCISGRQEEVGAAIGR